MLGPSSHSCTCKVDDQYWYTVQFVLADVLVHMCLAWTESIQESYDDDDVRSDQDASSSGLMTDGWCMCAPGPGGMQRCNKQAVSSLDSEHAQHDILLCPTSCTYTAEVSRPMAMW